MFVSEHPVLIVLTGILAIAAAAAGIYFASLAFRQKKEKHIKFVTLSAVERSYRGKSGRDSNRNMIFIRLCPEGDSDETTEQIRKNVKAVLLDCFSVDGGMIAAGDMDEFVALNQLSPEDADGLIEECLQRIGQLETQVRFGCYYGVASEVSYEECLKRARSACDYAEAEKERSAKWDYRSYCQMEEEKQLEENIGNDISENRFFLEFQPVIHADTGKIVGVEILSRLNSENGGIVPPDRFLSSLSVTGLSDLFDYYIFDKGCCWLSNRENLSGDFRFVSTNFSRATISESIFPELICQIVERHGVPYHMLAIEVLEEDADGVKLETVHANLEKLKEKGMTVFLDDFGSGCTSLADLQNYPADILKIDKQIIQNTDTTEGMTAFRSIVKLAKDVGAYIVCEGVETAEQDAIARQAGCDMVQGFYHYCAMPAEEFDKLVCTQP